LGENIFINKFKKLKIRNCIDIGSNQGEYAKQILHNPDIKKVICFEPLPEYSNNLSILKSFNKGKLWLHKVACSNKNGFSYIYYNKKTPELASLELAVNNISYVNNNKKKKNFNKKIS
jgi:FkbM family methyltransferase